jgi:signal transduction histidine kinase
LRYRAESALSNLVSNSIKFTDRGSVRIVTKLLYPRMGPSPENEIDDPLDQAARNSAAQERPQSQPQAFEMQRYGSGPDVEKGSLHIEARRHSRDEAREQQEKEERNRHKAVVRVEIHDTGVGLKKQDVIE